nr:MAG: hypothetical protein DIU70_01510 [Bacillota bacterium]
MGITSAVFVNALAKAEAAGVLDAWSRGAKGTLIRIFDRQTLEEAVRE